MKKVMITGMLLALSLTAMAQNKNDSLREDRPPMEQDGDRPMPPLDKNGKPLPPPGGFGKRGPGHHGPGGPGGMTKESVGAISTTGYAQKEGTKDISGKTFTSTKADENAVQVTGGTLNLSDVKIEKCSGDTKSGDGSSFYGTNSALYVAGKNSILNVQGGTITTDAEGANAGFAYNGGTLNIKDVTIDNSKGGSRGIHATGGGIINAYNLTVTTRGAHSSVVATDRGGGTVNVEGGYYHTSGTDCAVLYSTGTITCSHAKGWSEIGEVGVIEGDNTITINQSEMKSSATNRGLMILQSGSGDSQGFNGKIFINDSKIILTQAGTPLCEVPTNITGTLTLKDADLTVPSKILMLVDYNKRWSTKGGTGNLILKTDSQHTYEGTVKTDEYGKVNVTVGKGVIWKLTADTHVNTLTVEEGGNIDVNGFHLTYDKKQ